MPSEKNGLLNVAVHLTLFRLDPVDSFTTGNGGSMISGIQ